MSEYILSCCSTVDLTGKHLEHRKIHFLRMKYELDGVTHEDNFGDTVPLSSFYHAMELGAEPKTSQINVFEYLSYFENFLKQGKDILHVSFSSGLSGTVNSARMAASVLSQRYTDRKILVLDSLAGSSGYGMLMDYAADLRDSGLPLLEVAARIEQNKLKLHHWFYSTTLKYYIRGGRVSKTAGLFGEILGICPLLCVDAAGRLIPKEKVRSHKRVIRTIVEKMKQTAENGTAYSGKCYISHSNCEEDARQVAELVMQNFPNLDGKPEIYHIGATIGSHSGPGTVALFFWGIPREASPASATQP